MNERGEESTTPNRGGAARSSGHPPSPASPIVTLLLHLLIPLAFHRSSLFLSFRPRDTSFSAPSHFLSPSLPPSPPLSLSLSLSVGRWFLFLRVLIRVGGRSPPPHSLSAGSLPLPSAVTPLFRQPIPLQPWTAAKRCRIRSRMIWRPVDQLISNESPHSWSTPLELKSGAPQLARILHPNEESSGKLRKIRMRSIPTFKFDSSGRYTCG